MVPEIDVDQLKQLIESRTPPLLLDVREPEERLIVSFPDSLFVPLMELEERIDELRQCCAEQPERLLVVYCRVGGRSALAVQFLASAGIGSAVNLRGGIRAYAEQVDTSFPVY